MRRLGYQQFGEVDTVLSALLKKFLVGRSDRAPREDCRFYFRQLLRARPTEIEVRLLEWCRDFTSIDDVHKKEKPKLWAMGDEFVESLPSMPTAHQGLLSNIALAYLNSYKLAKCFNGLRLGLIAYRLQQEIEPILRSDRKLESVLDRIVEGEPSSYEIAHRRNVVVLKQPVRRVKEAASRRKKKKGVSETEPVLFSSEIISLK